jgi:hypothetical protein
LTEYLTPKSCPWTTWSIYWNESKGSCEPEPETKLNCIE